MQIIIVFFPDRHNNNPQTRCYYNEVTSVTIENINLTYISTTELTAKKFRRVNKTQTKKYIYWVREMSVETDKKWNEATRLDKITNKRFSAWLRHMGGNHYQI